MFFGFFCVYYATLAILVNLKTSVFTRKTGLNPVGVKFINHCKNIIKKIKSSNPVLYYLLFRDRTI
ncbi:hypothetical protein SAMN05192550_1769 [Flavobacterium glycines]|uniref:Uncharacterized protein n=1 Tax=Flavobacterium glycines TaxID=551990 RepID=A0A1G8SE15_9FLAO|nr:hypothetical protein SAMN05192550_1769 [Flavobacterium glycines]